MNENTKCCQYVLLKVAQKRRRNDNNRRVIFRKGVEIDGKKLPAIELGPMDLVHDFISLVLLLNPCARVDGILANKGGIFLPSVMSSIRYMPGIEIRENEKGQEIVLMLEDVFKKIKGVAISLRKEIDEGSASFADRLVNFYPPQKENINFFLRIAGCFWLSGRKKEEIPLVDFLKSYKYHWGGFPKEKIELFNQLFKKNEMSKRGH